MPPLKPFKGRKVWRVCVDAQHWSVTNDSTLIALFGGKLFTTKEPAEAFAMRAVLEWPEFIGEIVVEEHVCTGEEGHTQSFEAFIMNPPRGRRRK